MMKNYSNVSDAEIMKSLNLLYDSHINNSSTESGIYELNLFIFINRNSTDV